LIIKYKSCRNNKNHGQSAAHILIYEVIIVDEPKLITTEAFEGLQCDIYQDEEDYYMTREQIGIALGYSSPRIAITKIHDRYKERLDKFSTVTKVVTVDGKTRDVILYSRMGIMEICRRSKQPKADDFMDFTWKVMTSLISGQYRLVAQVSENQHMIAESRLLNAQARKAREYENLAALYRSTEYAKILDSYASEVLAGKPLIPLPELPERTYTATEIGKKLGISAKRVGMLTNEHDLKTKEYGLWFRDVALHRQDMEVPAFRYFENIIPVLRELL